MSTARSQGYEKGRTTRAELIACAADLFGKRGYRATSIREVAARCGLTNAGLIHHFKSKEELLVAVLAQRDKEDLDYYATPPRQGVERLRRLVAIVERNENRRGIVELFAVLSAEATAPDHPAHTYFSQRYESAVGAAIQAFQDAQHEGALIDGVDVETAAAELIALMDGLQLQWLYGSGVRSMTTVVRSSIERLLNEPLRERSRFESAPAV